jgi:hypothetical protein
MEASDKFILLPPPQEKCPEIHWKVDWFLPRHDMGIVKNKVM